MNRRPSLFAALALSLVLSACGQSEEKAAEILAEKALEANSGQDVDVDIDEDGETVTIQTEQGTIKQSSGDNVALPDDFPTDVTLPGDYKVMSVMTMGAVTSVVMEVPEAPSSVFTDIKAGQARRSAHLGQVAFSERVAPIERQLAVGVTGGARRRPYSALML